MPRNRVAPLARRQFNFKERFGPLLSIPGACLSSLHPALGFGVHLTPGLGGVGEKTTEESPLPPLASGEQWKKPCGSVNRFLDRSFVPGGFVSE